MELINDSTLRQELDAQPGNKLPSRRIAEIIEQLVAALSAVHKAELCHLDIKPHNIMLTPEGRVVLVDFGAAKQVSITSRQSSSTGTFTEEYAAPEILLGLPVGPESDIFELGMTLHEMLAGELPKAGLSRIFGDTWTAESFPEPWRSLLSAALRLKKEERPNSVREWWESANPPNLPLQKESFQFPPNLLWQKEGFQFPPFLRGDQGRISGAILFSHSWRSREWCGDWDARVLGRI